MDIWQFFLVTLLRSKRERTEGRKEKGNVEYNFTSKRERESRREETEC